jgi:hypothetical protein
MIDRCRARIPDSAWIVADMRELDLGRHFDGILAWDSFFHLDMDEQRLVSNGFVVRAHVPEDSTCGQHTVWLATYDGKSAV